MSKLMYLSKTFIVIFLVLASLNCHRKDEDDYITGPNSGINIQFRNLVSSKTFNAPGYLTADDYFKLEFSDYNIPDEDNKIIAFDSKGLPSKFFSIDQKTNMNTVKTIKLHSTPSITQGIYYIKATGVSIDNNDTIGDVEMYIGIELAGNGNLLYQTDPVIEWRLSGEQCTISAQNVKWNTAQLVAVKFPLDATATASFLDKLPIWFEGAYVSTSTYTNSDYFSGDLKYFEEYLMLKISNNNAGDIIFTYFDEIGSGNYFNPSRTEAIKDIYNNKTFYWDFPDTSSQKYTTLNNKSYLFKISENRYVNITAYQNFINTSKYKARVYDLEKINNTQLKIHNAKYYGNKYKDLIFEKVDGVTLP